MFTNFQNFFLNMSGNDDTSISSDSSDESLNQSDNSDDSYDPMHSQSDDMSIETDEFSKFFERHNSNDSPDDSEPLLNEIDVNTLLEVLPLSLIRFDIDSIILSSSYLYSLLSSLDERSIFNVSTSVDRFTRATKSRLNVTFHPDFPFNGRKKMRTLNLGSFPNIEVGTVTIVNQKFHLHMFWLNPSFTPKTSFFHSKYALVVTAALNMARLWCKDQPTYVNNPYNLNQEFFPSKKADDLRIFVDELMPFELNQKKSKETLEDIQQESYDYLFIIISSFFVSIRYR